MVISMVALGIAAIGIVANQPRGPSISPSSGAPGSPFTITDPQGRMEPGDVVMFYLDGTSPAAGFLATNVTINIDGGTCTGEIPRNCVPQTQYLVSVRAALAQPARFGDLAFLVTN